MKKQIIFKKILKQIKYNKIISNILTKFKEIFNNNRQRFIMKVWEMLVFNNNKDFKFNNNSIKITMTYFNHRSNKFKFNKYII